MNRHATLAWALAALHFGYILGVLAGKAYEPYPGPPKPDELSFSGWRMYGTMIAGRYFHHEPLLTDLVIVADLPVLLPGWLLLFALDRLLGEVATSYAAAAIWLLGGSLQWYLIGRALARIGGRASRPPASGILPDALPPGTMPGRRARSPAAGPDALPPGTMPG